MSAYTLLWSRRMLAGVASLTMACAFAAPNAAPEGVPAHDDGGIAWIRGDADAAFARARAEHKPVFLYWGAVWCPPCNQVKATIFNRPEFIERTRALVPVYLDGDTPNAQRLASRFRVSGYPTMILLRPDGSEIVRLPGEVDAQKYLQGLALGLSAARSAHEALTQARRAPASLTAADWRLLALYAWDVDDERLVAKAALPATLQRLAARCPASAGDACTRLSLKALVAIASAPPAARPAFDRAAATDRVRSVIADPARTRDAFDVLVNNGSDLVALLAPAQGDARTQLRGAMDEALARLAGDASLSDTDRLAALASRVQLARLDLPKDAPLPEPLRVRVREEVARADHASTTPEARQTVINAAAYALGEAGLLDDADRLLRAELTRSPSPYYFMSDLAANAKKRGDAAGALDWYAKAYAASQGPATRLQWGVAYVNALLELAPDDDARIERAATQVLGELDLQPATFEGRNAAVLQRLGTRLATWRAHGHHDASFARMRTTWIDACAHLPARDASRARCEAPIASRPASASTT